MIGEVKHTEIDTKIQKFDNQIHEDVESHLKDCIDIVVEEILHNVSSIDLQ